MNGFGRKGLIAITSLVLFMVFFVSMPVFAAGSIGSIGKYRYDDASRYTAGGASLDVREYGIVDIDISWVAGNVSIEYWDGGSIEVSEVFHGGYGDSDLLRWRVSKGCLYVKYVKSGLRLGNISKDLVVKIPNGLSLRNIELDTVSADTSIGSATNGILVDDFEYESVSGRLDAAFGYVYEVDVESVSGPMKMAFGTCPRKLDAKTVTGSVEVVVPDGSLYSVEMDSVSGRLTSTVANLTNGRYRPVGATSEFEFETVSGNVTVK